MTIASDVERRSRRRLAETSGARRRLALDDIGDRWLVVAAALFAVAELFHGYDHFRRGVDASPRDVFWLGTLAVVLEVVVVVLAVQRHRLAPLANAVGGATLATGYFVVHFLPQHPLFSDSFTSASSVSPLSWLAASLEIVTAAGLAIGGVTALRRRGGLTSSALPYAGQRPWPVAVRHPVALTMIAGNATLLVLSLHQLAAG